VLTLLLYVSSGTHGCFCVRSFYFFSLVLWLACCLVLFFYFYCFLLVFRQEQSHGHCFGQDGLLLPIERQSMFPHVVRRVVSETAGFSLPGRDCRYDHGRTAKRARYQCTCTYQLLRVLWLMMVCCCLQGHIIGHLTAYNILITNSPAVVFTHSGALSFPRPPVPFNSSTTTPSYRKSNATTGMATVIRIRTPIHRNSRMICTRSTR
jgi:hypothetical protein